MPAHAYTSPGSLVILKGNRCGTDQKSQWSLLLTLDKRDATLMNIKPARSEQTGFHLRTPKPGTTFSTDRSWRRSLAKGATYGFDNLILDLFIESEVDSLESDR